MIAEAIKEAKPEYRRVMVDLATIRWTNPRTKKRYICLTPEAAGLALVAFDQGEAVEPFSLTLRPIQVTPAGTRMRAADGTVRVTRTRGRKRLQPDGTIRGGRELRTGHLSNVQVSRQDVRVYGRRLLRA